MPSDTSRVGARAPARLQVRLLGGAEVILDGHRMRAFESPRLQRFLALLALRKAPQQRSRLAAELWLDSSERQARTNLRKLLHEFRNSLPEAETFVEIGNETLQWIPNGPSEVDVLAFRDAIASGDFDLAARLYTGDLLPACYDDWVLDERRTLQAEALRALRWLTEEAARSADHKATLRHAQRIIDLEPTDEAAVRFLMEAHRCLGDRAAALRSYHRYAKVLERELEVTPDGAVEALYQELRNQSAEGAASAEDLFPVVDSAFVGRDREWVQLNKAWKNAQQGHAHLVLVTGEPGIGKSRLAIELRRHVQAEGHVVASTRGYEAAGRLPWGPVVDLLRSEPLRSHIDSLQTPWKTELARLLPERLDTVQDGSDPSPAVAQRHRLFDAVGRAIVSTDRPRLLIIDDLQWCDAETIELIGFIVRTKRAAPILIVGTLRSAEISNDHPLVALIDSLEQDQAVTTIPLGRLDEAATMALAARLHGDKPIQPELAARLWSESEGNPLFIIEVLRAGVSNGEGVLTPTMRAVLRARLSQLTDGARRLAETAAVYGRPFSIDLMASASGTNEQEVVDHVDELWRRKIIQDRGFRYDFSHDKLRAAAVELVNPARRRLLHKAIAEAIAATHRDAAGAVSAQLAAHYDQAGMIEPAIDAYRIAGTEAAALSALEESVSMFRRALALLAELPNSDARRALELEIRIALGAPLVALEGYGSKAAHQLYERALSLCRALRRPVEPPILRGLGLARLQGCRFEQCTDLAQALLDHESGDPIAKTEGRYLLGVSAFWQGDLANARDHLDRAIKGYDKSHCHAHLSRFAQDPRAVCLVRRALVKQWVGDPGGAEQMARSALEYAAELDHLMTSAYVITYASMLAAEAEAYERLCELLTDADQLWRRVPIGYLRYVLDALRGMVEVRGGSTEGIDKIAQSVTRSRAEQENLHLTYTLLLLARARGRVGELGEGRAAVRDALSWTERCNQRYLEAELWRVDGELAYRSGEADVAATSLRQAVTVAENQGAGWLGLRALYSLASRFPDRASRDRLAAAVEAIPSGHDLPAFQAAKDFLSQPL